MSPEAERAAEVREWLTKAALDLRGAQIDLAAEPALLEDALFHCQQLVEKVLKAFLVWHDRSFRKTHSLEEIGRVCCEIDPALTDIVDEAVPLTEYAWAFRYPGAPRSRANGRLRPLSTSRSDSPRRLPFGCRRLPSPPVSRPVPSRACIAESS